MTMTRLPSVIVALLLLISLSCSIDVVEGIKSPPRVRGSAPTRNSNRELGGDDEVAEAVVLESVDCMLMSKVADSYTTADAGSDSACLEDGDGCPGGCCRLDQDGNSLQCDTETSFPLSQCVCNGNTRKVGMYNGWTLTTGGKETKLVAPAGMELSRKGGDKGGSGKGGGKNSNSAVGAQETSSVNNNDNGVVNSAMAAPPTQSPNFHPDAIVTTATVIGIGGVPITVPIGTPSTDGTVVAVIAPAPAPGMETNVVSPGSTIEGAMENPDGAATTTTTTTGTIVTGGTATATTADTTTTGGVTTPDYTTTSTTTINIGGVNATVTTPETTTGTTTTTGGATTATTTGTTTTTTTGGATATVVTTPATNGTITAATATGGVVQPDACAVGSWFTNQPAFATFHNCSSSEDCYQAVGECCLADFCLCGKPNGDIPTRCVPPFDLTTLLANP